jgi:dolichyl-phosphate-mannose-protein mannosyltransferase
MTYGHRGGDVPSALPGVHGPAGGDPASDPTRTDPSTTQSTTQPPASHRARPRPERPTGAARWVPSWWPLLVILIVQAAASIRLVKSDTAFLDEAAYLWAGHLEWAHWLHGAPVPPFSAYFSGAPVIYPPIAALADSLGGLAAARLLSLIFMLGATALLWGATTRLFGRRAGFFASALFAVLGPTLHLGAFATFDALSLLLCALATWLVVRAGDKADATGWMIAAGVVLALANATAYSCAILDPVIIGVALLTALPTLGGKAAARRAAILLVVLVLLLAAGLLAGGHDYLTGVGKTTLARVPGAASPGTVLIDTWAWTGLIAVLAIGALVISLATRQPGTRSWLLGILASAALLGPLDQARLHTEASLNKHLGLGAWFAAIAAGYAVDRFIAASPPGRTRQLTGLACVLALAFPLSLGATQSREFSTSWPNAGSFTAIFGSLVAHNSGRLLVEDPSIAEYYLPGHDWQRWSSTRNIVLPNGRSTGGPTSSAGVTGAGNAGVFAEFITEGYFKLVALNFADTTTLDHQITRDLRRSHHYKVMDVIPYGPGTYIVWKYEPRG